MKRQAPALSAGRHARRHFGARARQPALHDLPTIQEHADARLQGSGTAWFMCAAPGCECAGAPKYGDSMFCTTRDTTIGEPDGGVDATEGSTTMDITCTVDGGSASAAASAGARPAEHGLAGRKVTLRDLKSYYETHDQAKATDANCKKLLSSYTDDEIFKALERKCKSPLVRAIDLDDF